MCTEKYKKQPVYYGLFFFLVFPLPQCHLHIVALAADLRQSGCIKIIYMHLYILLNSSINTFLDQRLTSTINALCLVIVLKPGILKISIMFSLGTNDRVVLATQLRFGAQSTSKSSVLLKLWWIPFDIAFIDLHLCSGFLMIYKTLNWPGKRHDEIRQPSQTQAPITCAITCPRYSSRYVDAEILINNTDILFTWATKTTDAFEASALKRESSPFLGNS